MIKKFLAVLLTLSLATPIMALDYTHSYNQDGRGTLPVYTISDVVEVHNGTTQWMRDGATYDLTTLTVEAGATIDLAGMYLIQFVPVTVSASGVYQDTTETMSELIDRGALEYVSIDNSEAYFASASLLSSVNAE